MLPDPGEAYYRRRLEAERNRRNREGGSCFADKKSPKEIADLRSRAGNLHAHGRGAAQRALKEQKRLRRKEKMEARKAPEQRAYEQVAREHKELFERQRYITQVLRPTAFLGALFDIVDLGPACPPELAVLTEGPSGAELRHHFLDVERLHVVGTPQSPSGTLEALLKETMKSNWMPLAPVMPPAAFEIPTLPEIPE